MTKLWIDNNLVIRWHENWPKHPQFTLTQYTSGFYEDYTKAIEQAKADSLPVIAGVFDVEMKADTFIEVPGHASVIYQYKPTRELVYWMDCHVSVYREYEIAKKKGQYRKVVRIITGEEIGSIRWNKEKGDLEIVADQTPNLRARILEEFNNITNADNAYQALEWTLDRLNIK